MTVSRLHGLLACRLILKWKTHSPQVQAKTATRWMQRNLLAKFFHLQAYNKKQQNNLRRNL